VSEKEWKPIELKPGSGMLFKNKWKKEGDKKPEYVGEIEIPEGMHGRKEISLWKRMSKAGKPYLSVSVSDPWKPERKPIKAAGYEMKDGKVTRDPDFDDDIPF
jgi:uncharacterized protein (DUF736 family)